MKLESVYNERVIERGEDYLDNVKSCIKIGDFLFAEVRGGSLYKTKVNLKTLEGECSCPYEHNCKHAVAAYLYHKKGRSNNADEFLLHLKNLSKEELIKLVESMLPEKPELIKKYSFRKKTDFNTFVDDFINSFSISEIENIEDNLDCLNFEQLLKILDYTYKNEDSINDSLSENFNRDGYYEDEEDILGDFQFTIKEEIIKRIGSQEQLVIVLKKGYMSEEITGNAEQFFKYKEIVRKYFSKEQYLRFLLKCKNPDLSEIKENMTKDAQIPILMLPKDSIELGEKLAEYLDNDDLRFIVAYQKDDANGIIKHFNSFANLKKYYLVQPHHIVKILSKTKKIPETIARQLFRKEYFESYSVQNIRFLVNNINEKEFILNNADFDSEFSKLKAVIVRLKELRYDSRLFFKKKELLDRKHWTQIIEVLNFARQSFGDKFVEELIRIHKSQFITSSTLKYNLKKEGISIQNIRGELNVEIR